MPAPLGAATTKRLPGYSIRSFLVPSFDVLHLLTHLIDQTFMSTPMRVSSRAADFDPRVLASRWSSSDQEVEALADLPALLDQPLDLVEVRIEAGELLGHVDADRRAVASASARSWAASGGVPLLRPMAFLPALEKRVRVAVLRGPVAAAPASRGQQLAQMGSVQRGRQPRAFALPGLRHAGLLSALPAASRSASSGPSRPGGAVASGQAAARRHTPSVAGAGGSLPGMLSCTPLRRWSSSRPRASTRPPCARGARLDGGPHSTLPRLEPRPVMQLAQAGPTLAQLLGQLEAEVEKTAVDRADLDPEPTRARRSVPRLPEWLPSAGLAAGIAGHAANWHCASLVVLLHAPRRRHRVLLAALIAFGRNSRIMSKVKPTPLLPDTVIGGYRVVAGFPPAGFGVVYLAIDPSDQQVAIKEYLPSSLATRAPGELAPQVPAGEAVTLPAGAQELLRGRAARSRRSRTPRWSACSISSARTKPSTWS